MVKNLFIVILSGVVIALFWVHFWKIVILFLIFGFIYFLCDFIYFLCESRNDINDKKREMQSWTQHQLHSYAGVRSHPEELKEFAYHLAKQKRFEDSFK
jgi:hypothetical protein